MFTGKDIKGLRKKFYESQKDTWKKQKSIDKFQEFADEIINASGIKPLSGLTVLNWERNPKKSIPKKWWKGLQKLGEQLYSKEDQKYTQDEEKVTNEFLDKLKQSLKDLSRPLLIKSVSLFLYAQSSTVTAGEKIMIYGSLAYFIIPIDAIPDFTPLIGYSDDLAMIIGTINRVLGKIAHKYEQKSKDWLNNNGIFVND